MKFKSIIILFGIILLSASIFGQSKNEKKFQKAIDALESTEFIKELRSSKKKVESAVLDFKLQEEYFEKEDVDRVKACYQETIDGYDKILENMKNKLMDKKRRESIVNDPDDYTELMQFRLEKIMEIHRENCIPMIEEITGVEAVGFGIEDIKFIIGLVSDIVNALQGNGKSFDKMGEEYLEDNFIVGLRISNWEDL